MALTTQNANPSVSTSRLTHSSLLYRENLTGGWSFV